MMRNNFSKEKKFDIVLAIDTCVDLLMDCGKMRPAYGQAEQLVQDYSMELGGSGGIFACGASKLGLRTAGVGTVGTDLFGTYVKEALEQNGVDTRYIQIRQEIKTGVGVALCLENHDRAIMTYNGSIQEAEGSAFTEELMAESRHIHIASYFLMKRLQSAYPEILSMAKDYGVSVSLDTNWDPKEEWESGLSEVLPFVDVFLPNAHEAFAITGETEVQAALKKLSRQVPLVVLKEGSKGALALYQNRIFHSESFSVPVVDTVGAGDNFDAGFIYGFLHQKSVEESLRIACACGSCSTRMPGGIKGQLTREELNQLMQNPFSEALAGK